MKATLDSKELKRLIDGTKQFLDNKRNLICNSMSYIRLRINLDIMSIEATAVDGKRISVERAKLMDCDESFECFIKPALLPSINKLKQIQEVAEIKLEDNIAYITIQDHITGCRQPDTKYVNVDPLRKQFDNETIVKSITVNAKLLKDALANVKDECGKSLVIIDILEDEKMPIIIRHKQGERYILPSTSL